MKNVDLNNLFVLDLANNHQGDLKHGINIIEKLSEIVKKEKVKAAIKFQFRQLESFIHPNFKNNKTTRRIDRFESTELTIEDYKKMISKIKSYNILTMCTPFDEESLDVIKNLDIDILKIASCSATDIPLIKEIAKLKYPIIASTGGASADDIDFLVNTLESNNAYFALNHCIPIYPTPKDKLQLNQIAYLKKRYFGVPVGWSTHEDPDDTSIIQLAFAKGATIFERHVGLETEKYKLNKYSSNPSQILKWIKSYKSAIESCGPQNRSPATEQEIDSLNSLLRGVYAKTNIKKGDSISLKNTLFAMPYQKNFMSVRDWNNNLIADKNYKINEPINKFKKNEITDSSIIYSIVVQTRAILREAKIYLKRDQELEISHHYGLQKFREFGIVIINLINKSYCKKLIIQLPRQKHPYHYHEKKEETFHILYGRLEVEKNGKPQTLDVGDIFHVEPKNWHKFSSNHGVVFEEISTTHFKDDSFYEDSMINEMTLKNRKTIVKNF